jgi:dehydrogenase/reductase SDR family protein 12
VKDWQYENKSYNGTQAYAFTKRHQRYLAEIWAKKFGDKGIHFWSMHPGWARTPQTKTALPAV